MSTTATIELKAERTFFFSQLDEDAFFHWLKKLPCVSSVEGKGDTLFIRVLESKVDESGFRELLALFWRYDVNMRQLTALDKREFAHWLHNKDAYWYRSVFGS